MKQRLAIASAMLGDPEVMVLDEPTNGLDPVGIADIRELITEIGKSGKTIIIASHILDEIEKVCTHCAILKQGKLLKTGTIAEIIGNQNVTLIKVGSPQISALKLLVDKAEHLKIYKDLKSELIIEAPLGTQAEEINKYFFDQGQVLSELHQYNESLENQFLNIIKEEK